MSDGTAAPTEGTPAEGGGQQQTGQATGQNAEWFSGFDEETRGWLSNRGMTQMSPDEALAAAIKGHRHAEQSLGVPQDRRIDLPVDMAADGAMDPVYNRLGRPETADKYVFKDSDPTGVDKAFDDFFRTEAHKRGMSAEHADGMYSAFKAFIGETAGASSQDAATQRAAEETLLQQEWGATYTGNVNVANAAALKLGLNADQVAAMQDALGFTDTMKMLQKVGAGFGEDKFVDPNTVPGADGLTPEGAKAQIAELKADKEFTEKYINGDVKSRKLMERLHVIATGG